MTVSLAIVLRKGLIISSWVYYPDVSRKGMICCKLCVGWRPWRTPKKAFVESALEELQFFIKTPMFNKEKALDYLVNLKVVAKKTSHPRSGFFNAVI